MRPEEAMLECNVYWMLVAQNQATESLQAAKGSLQSGFIQDTEAASKIIQEIEENLRSMTERLEENEERLEAWRLEAAQRVMEVED